MSRNRSEGLRGVLSVSVSPALCVSSRYRDRPLMAFNWPSSFPCIDALFHPAYLGGWSRLFPKKSLANVVSLFAKQISSFNHFAWFCACRKRVTLRGHKVWNDEDTQKRDWKILAVSVSRSKSRNPLSLLYPIQRAVSPEGEIIVPRVRERRNKVGERGGYILLLGGPPVCLSPRISPLTTRSLAKLWYNRNINRMCHSCPALPVARPA